MSDTQPVVQKLFLKRVTYACNEASLFKLKLNHEGSANVSSLAVSHTKVQAYFSRPKLPNIQGIEILSVLLRNLHLASQAVVYKATMKRTSL